MFGSHLSIAGGMVNALVEAERLGMDCVQVFTKNQRQWRVKPLDPVERDVWLAKLKEMGWHKKTPASRRGARVVSHNSYLINMGSPDKEAWAKSVNLQRIELERCEELKIPLCVSHPGAHMGDSMKPGTPRTPEMLEAPPNKDELGGLKRIVKALDKIHADLPGYATMTCLETTVGSGTNLGYRFEDLAWIRENVKEPERIGYCLDTCHVLAAGYDMTSEKATNATLRQFDRVCGLKHLKVFHFNDSQGARGSRKDRHAHIGAGECGKGCFRAIVNRTALNRVPKILETPKGDNDKGMAWDSVNIRVLRGLKSA